MRSRTSRGVLEWSGGKDLYMGSLVLVTGKVLGAIGNVMVREGPRLRGPSVGGDQPQVGWCAPPPRPKAHGRVGGGKP